MKAKNSSALYIVRDGHFNNNINISTFDQKKESKKRGMRKLAWTHSYKKKRKNKCLLFVAIEYMLACNFSAT